MAALNLSACADSDDPQNLLDRVRRLQGIPGMAAAVITPDRVSIYTSGVRRLGTRQPIGRNDLFHVGSDAKAMLATVAAREVEAGLIRWDTTVEETLPDLVTQSLAGYRGVTLKNLLQHRSGLPGFETADEFAEIPELTGSPTEQREQFVQWVFTREPAAQPGEGFQYSNAGYVVAAAMLERVTGSSYEELMDVSLFRPLNIRPVYDLPAAGGRHDQPWGHALVDGKLVAVDPDDPENRAPAWSNPAGNLSLSTADFARFVQLHLRGLRGQPQLLSLQSFQTLHTPEGDYAYGWLLLDDRGMRASTHSGSNDSFYAFMIIEPDAAAATVVVANASSPAIDEAVIQLGLKLLPRKSTP